MKQQRFDIVYSYKLVKRVTLGAVDMHSRCNKPKSCNLRESSFLVGNRFAISFQSCVSKRDSRAFREHSDCLCLDKADATRVGGNDPRSGCSKVVELTQSSFLGLLSNGNK
jgi:hypothetical protein